MEPSDSIVKADSLVPNKRPTKSNSKNRDKHVVYDQPGRFMLINKHELYVDQSYQRGDVNITNINAMVSNFSWAAFGAISVSTREGKWRVIDGQHRCLAALKIESINEIPCMVFEHFSQTGEAKTFLSANSNRTAVNSFTKFKAGLVANDDVCVRINAAVGSLGYFLNHNACKPFDLACIAALMKAEKESNGAAYEILNATKPLARQGVISSTLVRALMVVRNNIPDGLGNKTLRSRMSIASLSVIEKFMKDESLMAGKGAPSIWAKGLINAVNANHRQKIRMVKHEDGE